MPSVEGPGSSPGKVVFQRQAHPEATSTIVPDKGPPERGRKRRSLWSWLRWPWKRKLRATLRLPPMLEALEEYFLPNSLLFGVPGVADSGASEPTVPPPPAILAPEPSAVGGTASPLSLILYAARPADDEYSTAALTAPEAVAAAGDLYSYFADLLPAQLFAPAAEPLPSPLGGEGLGVRGLLLPSPLGGEGLGVRGDPLPQGTPGDGGGRLPYTPQMGGGGSGGGGPGGSGNANASMSNPLFFAALQGLGTPGASATGATSSAAGWSSGFSRSGADDRLKAELQPQAPTPTAPHGPPSPPPAGSSDPLYVLDANTGVTLPANTTLNSFSTWSEDLWAQVGGASVTGYYWDTSAAPDLTNVSGQNTANLQGTWQSFTGPASLQTITLTEMSPSGNLSQTMTFLVAGTSSPAYSSQRPTASSTWSNVLTPDLLAADQATAAAGPYANLGLADGSVQTSFAMPSYNTNVAPLGLDYNSTTANQQPIFLVHYQLPLGQSVPGTISAQLTLNGTAGSTVYHNTSTLNPGDWMQIALQANASTLNTGRYPWSVVVTNGTNQTQYSGNVDLVNRASSPFGAGWSPGNVEQLVPVTGGVILVQPGGTSLFFAGSGPGTYTSPAGAFSTLVENQNGTYTRTLTDGTQIDFNSSGLQTSTVDRDGNTTTFTWNSSNQLTAITDWNNQTTSLAYNSSGQLATITDPANRTATLTYSGNQLVSIEDPGTNLWQYTYNSSNQLTTLTDPNTHATTFAYDFAGRAATVTRADGTTLQLTPEQVNGLAAPGTGTQSNPAASVLLAAGDQAQYTDGRNNVWTTEMDWLGFGLDTADLDPLGDASLTYRDVNGLPWLSADGLGRRTRDFFDGKGNTTEAVAPDDTTQQYGYNSFAEVTQYTDQENNVWSYTYNSKGDLTQVTDPLNDVTTYAYNSAGLVTSTTDARGYTTACDYNSLNELTSTTDALNDITTYSYDNAGDLVSTTDAAGYVSTFSYNALGWLTGETLPDSKTVSSTWTFGYDKVGNLLSVTDPLSHETTYGYDSLNRQTSMTDPLGDQTTYGYDAASNLTSVTNPLGDQSTYGYDAANRMLTATDPMGDRYGYGYDAAGEVTSLTDPLGTTFTFDCTPRGQLKDIYWEDPSGGTPSSSGGPQPLGVISVTFYQLVSISYEPCGCDKSMTVFPLPVSGSSAAGPLAAGPLTGSPSQDEVWTFQDDALHRLTSVTDPTGATTNYSYDADSNPTAMTDPLGHATTYGYNALDELTSVKDALGDQTTYGYDPVGNLSSIMDPLGDQTTFSYDGQGRVLTQTAANGGVTSYAYNLAGLLTALTDPDNNQTTYAYNAADELTASTDPLLHVTTYSYNQAGWLTAETDRDGRQTTYGYDKAGRLTSETWVGGNYTATFGYNAMGEVTSASDPFSQYSFTYDGFGDLTGQSNAGTPGAPTVTLSYTYDGFFNRSGMTDSLGGSISYSHDLDNRLTGMGLSLGTTLYAQLTFGYDAASRPTGITRTSPGGDTITSSLSYDNADRLTNIVHEDATKTVTLESYTYGYNAASELTSYQDANSSLTYGYDKVGELTSATGTLAGSSYSASYSYDLNGNRTMPGYQTGTGNELTSDGTYSYIYDNEGNLVSQTNISSGSVTYYSFDYENRLTEIKQENSQGQVVNDEKFTYDVFGNQIGESLNGTQQRWTVFDGSTPYLDFNGSGQLQQRYLENPDAPNQLYGGNLSSLFGSQIGGMLNWMGQLTAPIGLSQFYGQVSARGTPEWYLTDLLGSVRQVVSTGGSVLDAITYDPYGNLFTQTNSTYEPRFGYADGALDSMTGDYQFGARYYTPADGRWGSEDPAGFAGGDADLYRYAFNDPTNLVDPSGLASIRRTELPGGLVKLEYVPGFWLRHPFSDTGVVYIGTYDPNTGMVERGGFYAKLEDVENEVNRTFSGPATTQDWWLWFKSNDPRTQAMLPEAALPPSGQPLTANVWQCDPAGAYNRRQGMVYAGGLVMVAAGYYMLTTGMASPSTGGFGWGNIGSHAAVNPSEVLPAAERWLGSGYSEIAPGVFRSADGLRQFRMTASDLIPTHGTIGPHVHFETLNATGQVIENLHVPIAP
jgi:RHS repeat-associated protein